jgi:hypothetical protein
MTNFRYWCNSIATSSIPESEEDLKQECKEDSDDF